VSDVQAKVVWKKGLEFSCQTSRGVETSMDGDARAGASPVEILLEALGVCGAIDVVTILEKQRTPLTRMEIQVEGNRQPTRPRYFTAAVARYDLWGDGITALKVAKALELSYVKYCSVYHSLRRDLELSVEFRVHEGDSEGTGEYLPVSLNTDTTA
jgi:putative redox protein